MCTYKTKVICQTSGKYAVGDYEWVMRREAEAKRFYEYVRGQDDDIEQIAIAANMSTSDITQIKNHVFYNKYIKWDGSISVFNPQYDMAVAWRRLSNGKPTETDFFIVKARVS